MVVGTSFEMKYNLVFPFCTFAKEQMVSAVSINDHLLMGQVFKYRVSLIEDMIKWDRKVPLDQLETGRVP